MDATLDRHAACTGSADMRTHPGSDGYCTFRGDPDSKLKFAEYAY